MKKKEYMKPAMRTVELRHRTRMLDASPYSKDNQSVKMYRDREMRIEDKGLVW